MEIRSYDRRAPDLERRAFYVVAVENRDPRIRA